jgi:hypothetical protein
MTLRFSIHDSDGRVLADIRELLYVLAVDSIGLPAHIASAERLRVFQRERMEKEES